MNGPVLVVDDSPIIRAMLKKALVLSGQRPDDIAEASNGIEALQQLEKGPVGLMLADIHMPGMGGLELIERMAADPRFQATPVVVVSSDAGKQHEARLLALGVRAVLRKPFRPEQIRAVLRLMDEQGVTKPPSSGGTT